MLTINFTQVRAKWVRAVETLFPHLSALGVGQNYAGATPVMPQNTGNIASGSSRGSKGRGRGRGSAQPSPSFTPTTALRGRGGGGRGTGRPVAAGPPAFHHGQQVCFGFNNPSGCSRTKLTGNSCQDRNGTIYAHVCDHWDGARNSHCFGPHSRQVQGNH